MSIPEKIKTLFRERFGSPSGLIIAQVASIGNKSPDIRSMGLFDIDAKGVLIFLTNTFSNKWKQFLSCPEMAVLMLNRQQDTQVIARGQAELFTPLTAPELANKYWNLTPTEAKKAYAHANPESTYVRLVLSQIPASPPKNFGIICMKPVIWEFLDMDHEDYPSADRFRYTKTNDTDWRETRISAV